ncbi:MAG: hypothetical protein HUK04_07335 [Bacteroidaceae bacterium]|nr:hypothetical protein [Bacteroidaceae bacterium]
MDNKKILLSLAICCFCALTTFAQSSNDYNSDNASAYSRYGVGTLMPRANGFNISMAGAGLAVMSTNRINPSNPASYSAIDRETFLLDVGMSFDANVMKMESVTQTRLASRLNYVNIGFQLVKNLGLAIGYMPISSIGYDYSTSMHVGFSPTSQKEIRCATTYFGTGGIQQVFLGLGFSPFKNFSIGVNAGYLWGIYQHAMTQYFTEGGATSSDYGTPTAVYSADISTYSLDFGLQYGLAVSEKDLLSIGATFGLGHNTKTDATYLRYVMGADTINNKHCPKAFDLPMTFAGGLAYQHGVQWRVAADFEYQQWSKCTSPRIEEKGGTVEYVTRTGDYKDRMSVHVGGEFCPDYMSTSYLKRMTYRVGGFFNTPYVKVNGLNGPKEYGVTAGFMLPITNAINNRSCVNVGFRWNHVEPSSPGMIRENQYNITLGLTFNEQWFRKWKIR